MMSNNLVIGIGALVVGGVVGYFAGAGNEKIVEVEKVVEVEKQQTATLDAVKSKGFVQCGVSHLNCDIVCNSLWRTCPVSRLNLRIIAPFRDHAVI